MGVPCYGPSVDSSIQRSLVAAPHNFFLLVTLDMPKPGFASGRAAIVSDIRVVQEVGGALDPIGRITVLLSNKFDRDALRGAVGAAGLGDQCDRVQKNLTRRKPAEVLLAGVGGWAVVINDTPWLALSILTVEASCVWRLSYVAGYRSTTRVTESVVLTTWWLRATY